MARGFLSDTDPKTAALVQDVLIEMEWLYRHQDWKDFPSLVASRFTHYMALAVRVRDEDPRIFPVDLARAYGIQDMGVLGFVALAFQFFMGMGMVGGWTTVAEQLAAAKALKDALGSMKDDSP